MIHELVTPRQVAAACDDDDLVVWAAQDLTGGARAWAGGQAVLAAAPDICRRDRIAVWGHPADAADLVRHALAELGPGYRPFGETTLMGEVIDRVEGVERTHGFSWMSLDQLPIGPSDGVSWLEGSFDGEITRLLAADAPTAFATPGLPGVARWAGARVDGALAAVAADAWSAPTVGFMAGVATAAAQRGRGLAGRVCRWLSGRLVAAHGRAALMVDDGNAAALGLYAALGYRRRPVAVAAVSAAAA
ncbi:GNAT family N-acetyltransferase [Nonomuraea sp. NPDC059194]|uniref:GNAT family N-acetyltransferase n=1 Tax=Nonomuraea sp. NPDC059194 TaxID=3346764 RepID=UPI0036B4B732